MALTQPPMQPANRVVEAPDAQTRKFWMRWRVRFGYPVALLYWFLAAPTWRSIVYGTIIAILGLLVRGAASGYLRKDRALAVTGPYARTRNPLYLGSAILAAGFIVAAHSRAAGVLVGTYFAIFYYAVMRSEEKDLRRRFGADFDGYASRVPLFFPMLFAASGSRIGAAGTSNGESGFSWAQYRRNREYRALFGAIGAMALVCVRMWILARYNH